jgi:hypothetical protein
MKVLKAVGLIILFLELILVLAFWGGTTWIGGWKGGVILLSAVLIAVILPWIGKLEVEYDVMKGLTNIKLGWIGRIIMGNGPDRESRFRFLFFSWRSHPESRNILKNRQSKKYSGKRKITSMADENLESLSRVILAFFQALNEMIWEADEISLRIQAPTQISEADQYLARLVGKRWLGPLYLKVSAEGDREILVRFKIGLLKGILIVLYAFLQGRPLHMWRSVKA